MIHLPFEFTIRHTPFNSFNLSCKIHFIDYLNLFLHFGSFFFFCFFFKCSSSFFNIFLKYCVFATDSWFKWSDLSIALQHFIRKCCRYGKMGYAVVLICNVILNLKKCNARCDIALANISIHNWFRFFFFFNFTVLKFVENWIKFSVFCKIIMKIKSQKLCLPCGNASYPISFHWNLIFIIHLRFSLL